MTLYSVSVFLSAFLLFLIQPLIGKYLLPWFGGTSAFWSTAMFFFQLLLAGGYGYAHWLSQRHGSRTQGTLHLAVIGMSIALMVATVSLWRSPILPDPSWRFFQGDHPTWAIIRILTVAIGLPFLILSCNSPLMQSWSSRLDANPSPYRLYALSNVGSLLALLAYPTVIEPNLSLRLQAQVWSCGYFVFCILTCWVAVRALRTDGDRRITDSDAGGELRDSTRCSGAPFVHALWIALPACSSVLLLATTSQICQEVAVIPFLWILPLAIYLLSFVLVFSHFHLYSRAAYAISLLPASGLFVWLLIQTGRPSIGIQVALYSLALFVCCMICHGELAAIKPDPQRLTTYYLCISAGSVAGAAFVSFVAPRIFRGLWELPLGLVGTWILLTSSFVIRVPEGMRAGRRLALFAGLATTTAVLGTSVVAYVHASSAANLEVRRDFYGILRVRSVGDDPLRRSHQLMHGYTAHGFQFVDAKRRSLPTAYFTESSGVGLALMNAPGRSGAMRVGVLGLGVGTLVAYGRKGDTFRFYEIDPEVARLAASDYFSFLRDSTADVEIVIGDARIALEEELSVGKAQGFDVLAVDTFTGDAIPTHLLTNEALGIYLKHLRPEGVIALHISNRYIDLAPVVWRLAEAQRLSAVLIDDPGDGDRSHPSAWMLLTRNPRLLSQAAIRNRATGRPVEGRLLRLWTDDYSDLFSVLR